MAKVSITYRPSFWKSYDFQFVTITIGTDLWNIENFETKVYEIPSGSYQVKMVVDAYSNHYKYQNTRVEKYVTMDVKEKENYFVVVASGFFVNKLKIYTVTKEYFNLNSKNRFKINHILLFIGIGLLLCYRPLVVGAYKEAFVLALITIMLGYFVLKAKK